jgi:hypothetical protein
MSHYLSDTDRRYGKARGEGMKCRIAVVTWLPPLAPPAAPPAGRSASGSASRGRRLHQPPAAEGDAAQSQPGAPVTADCELLLPKARLAQALDVTVLLNAEFKLPYTDMALRYRGQPVADFELLGDLPDWDGEPRLELLVQPSSHTLVLQVHEKYGLPNIGWPDALGPAATAAAADGGHVDWIGRQLAAEEELHRARRAAGGAGAQDSGRWLAAQLVPPR